MPAIPNALILEREQIDVPVRYEVIRPHPVQKLGYIAIPTAPGLGCDMDDAVAARHPSRGNVSVSGGPPSAGESVPGTPPPSGYGPGVWSEQVYFQTRFRRQETMK